MCGSIEELSGHIAWFHRTGEGPDSGRLRSLRHCRPPGPAVGFHGTGQAVGVGISSLRPHYHPDHTCPARLGAQPSAASVASGLSHQLDQAKVQLAELTRLCPDSCDEKDVLTKSITDYELAANAPAQPVATPV